GREGGDAVAPDDTALGIGLGSRELELGAVELVGDGRQSRARGHAIEAQRCQRGAALEDVAASLPRMRLLRLAHLLSSHCSFQDRVCCALMSCAFALWQSS